MNNSTRNDRKFLMAIVMLLLAAATMAQFAFAGDDDDRDRHDGPEKSRHRTLG